VVVVVLVQSEATRLVLALLVSVVQVEVIRSRAPQLLGPVAGVLVVLDSQPPGVLVVVVLAPQVIRLPLQVALQILVVVVVVQVSQVLVAQVALAVPAS